MKKELFETLKQDHKKVKGIVSELSATTIDDKKKRQDLLITLKEELQKHENIEETVVYPILKDKSSTKDLALEAYEEHNIVDHLLEELEATDFKDETWKAKLTVLEENLTHHIIEEEGQLFPKALKELSSEEITEMNDGITEMKKES